MDLPKQGGIGSGVRFTAQGGIATVTLDRPHRRNAVDVAMANALTAMWRRIDEDESVLAAVVDATECGTFCSGMDLTDMAAIRASGDDPLDRMEDPFQTRMRLVSKPIVCALVGHFTGAGVLLAMSADIRVGLA